MPDTAIAVAIHVQSLTFCGKKTPTLPAPDRDAMAPAFPRTTAALVPSFVTTAVLMLPANSNADGGLPPSASALTAVVAVVAASAVLE